MLVGVYADHTGDGIAQTQFTLPTSQPNAAIKLAELMGYEKPEIIHKEKLTGDYTYYMVLGKLTHVIDLDKLETEPDPQWMKQDQIEQLAQSLGRKVRVVGATTGTDTHTVGLEAILNLKGIHGDKGLEAYDCFEVHNLGSQVANADLMKAAEDIDADAILVSQTVTQQGLHIDNLKELADMAKDRITFLACGGARLNNQQARELGYDAGFGKEALPHHVATAIVRAMLERRTDLIYGSFDGQS